MINKVVKFLYIFIFLGVCSFSNDYFDDDFISLLTRSDNIPQDSVENTSDPYFEGYLQSLVDMHFYEYRVIVLVKNKVVWLANFPKNELLAKSIKSFIKDVPGVEEVKVLNGVPPKYIIEREKYVNRPRINGIWFPQTTELYQPMIANPRSVLYSIGYRGGDKVISDHVIYVSMGSDFPIFRWLEVGKWKGDLQIGIEAGIWAVFDMDVKDPKGPKPVNFNDTTALVNTDYYCGIPISYAINKWSFRFRVYHISSHIGDEYLVNNTNFVPKRVNPSFEAIDFFTSYQATDSVRVYMGPGIILHSDDDYPMKHFYVEYGMEARFLGKRIYYHKLYGSFIAAAYFRHWQYLNWTIDGTYVFGYEWSKLQGVGRKIRVLASYHHGFSLEGQFSKRKTTYGAFGLAYGF